MKKLKKVIFFTSTLLIIVLGTSTMAQILQPVHWSYAAKMINKKEAVIFIRATMDEGWHIYSINQKDGGPLKTTITYINSKNYRLQEKTSEPQPTTKFEKAFGMDVNYFEKTVIFQQKVMLTSKDAVVRGKINFMTCSDKKCLPPDQVEFRVTIK